jgi:hypothetical protein
MYLFFRKSPTLPFVSTFFVYQNNKRFQCDEFIAGKASVNLKSLETSKPKTTSDFKAMNLLRGKQSKHPNQKQEAISTQ